MKVKFHYRHHPLNIDINTRRNVEVYIDIFNRDKVLPGDICIIILEEPFKSSLFLLAIARENRGCYTHLLTYFEELLDTNPKAKLFHCTNTWVKGYVPEQKKFCISTIVGGKDNPQMPGYALRHELWRNKELIITPKEFYLSSLFKWGQVDYTNNLVLGDSKTPLFDSMFHVAIENTSIKNYFTEKIIDCFQTRTVPIYCGCTNIGDFFNIDGIIVVSNVEEMVKVCNSVTPDVYNTMFSAMEDNFNRSEKWCDHDDQIRIGITKLVENL